MVRHHILFPRRSRRMVPRACTLIVLLRLVRLARKFLVPQIHKPSSVPFHLALIHQTPFACLAIHQIIIAQTTTHPIPITCIIPMANFRKVPFPRFDGDNPRRWKTRAEKYFKMYFVHQSEWINVSEMHFDGAASLWYQSVEAQVPEWSWEDFCAQIHDRFDRDRHELLIRQIFHINQSSTVSDYLARFSELVDQLKVYSPSHDPLFYTMRFIDGPCPDIKSVVHMHCPKDLETATTLALLQEEMAGNVPVKPPRHGDWHYSARSSTSTKGSLPLPPPPRQDRGPPATAPREAPTNDAKLAAIKSYRRTMGLCYKCAAPWSKGHKCAPEVLLAVEAIWGDFDDHTAQDPDTSGDPPDEQIFLAISKAAVLGTASARTVRFTGSLMGQPVHILLDSGSSSSFVNSAVAAQLTNVQSEPISTRVQVAGGSHLQSTLLLRGLTWTVGQCSFQSDFRVLPLHSYDVIVGMDWLEQFSPMQVHWRDKWLIIPYQNTFSLLQGLDSSDASPLIMQLYAVEDLPSHELTMDSLPPDIQTLIQGFPRLFQSPTSLPPHRACNHTIPLIPSA